MNKILRCPRCGVTEKKEGPIEIIGRIDLFRRFWTDAICLKCYGNFLNENFYTEEIESDEEDNS